MNQNKRATPLYGGYKVYSPEGKLMFCTSEKRVKWYLSRNLAKLLPEENSIALTFTPKGGGDPAAVLKVERRNCCVNCGCEDLAILTRHHVVPDEFRCNFPREYKAGMSILIVALCRKCHNFYEKEFASKIKDSLFAQINTYDVSAHNNIVNIIEKVERFAKRLERGFESEEDRTLNQEYLLKTLNKYLSKMENPPPIDTDRVAAKDLFYIESWLKEYGEKKNASSEYCKLITDYEEFSIMWFRDFMENMKPKYASEHLTENAVRDAFAAQRERKRLNDADWLITT